MDAIATGPAATTERAGATDITSDVHRRLVETRATTFSSKGTHPINERIDLVDGRWFATHLHEDQTWMRENAPVYHDPNSDLWAITTYEDLRNCSTSPSTFSSFHGIRPKTGHLPMMISFDDPEHRQRRSIVSQGFTPRRVADQEADIRRLCHELLDAVIESGSCDFVGDVAKWLPLIVIGDMLGIEREDREKLLWWSDELIKATTGEVADAEEATAAFVEYLNYQRAVIEDRRENPRDDLISTLVHAEVDGVSLTDDDLIFESLLILVGGDETSRHVVSGGMLQLLLHPEAMADLRADRSLLPAAIEEMLRWVTPIKSMSRMVTEDIEVGGQAIPAGDEILLLYSSANRDASVFDDPFTFDIRRSPNKHLAFGQGPHFCLGSSLAKLELVGMFDAVLDRMHDVELAVDPDKLEWRPSSFISGLEHLPITFTPGKRQD